MILYTFTVLSVATFGLCIAAEELTLPVTICKRDSADYSTCLKTAIQEAWPRFCKGLPEFGFPKLDPLSYEYQSNVFDVGEIHGEITISNTTIFELRDTKFLDIRPHFLDDTFQLQIDLFMPKVFAQGTIKASGKLATFKMGGEGAYNITMLEVNTAWEITGRVVNDRWIVEHYRALPSIKNMKIYFEDLFGSPELNNIVIDFVNEFWPSLYRGVLPIAAESWDVWLTEMANRLFSKVSFSKLFP